MHQTIYSLAALLLVCLIWITAPAPLPAQVGHDHISTEFSVSGPLAVCFAEGTDPDYIAEWTRRMTERVGTLDYNLSGRWSNTAHGGTGSQGDGITLTYSFVPDGVSIDGQPSQIYATLNQQFGSPAAWQAVFAQVFDRWSELTGNTYIFVEDDGANWSQNSPGIIGSRGDVRIGSIEIDGGSGVLAYNFFPNRGDMVLDASESWNSLTNNYRFMRNIVAHEHGHGLGISHVCPITNSKLLEPFYSAAFDGPQHDDILAGQRGYGDPFEPNDTPNEASELGQINGTEVVENASLDDNSDTDWWRFSVSQGRALTVTLAPDGYSYLEGEQNNDGSCQAGTPYNTADNQNLNFTLYAGPDTTHLITVANQGIGLTEELFRHIVPANVTDLKIHVWGATNNEIQLYRLTVEVVDPATPYLLGCPLQVDTTLLNDPVIGAVLLANPSQGGELSVTTISVTGPFEVSPAGPILLEPSAEIPLVVTYLAEELGTQTGTLTVSHSGPGGDLICSVSGTAITSEIVFLTGQVGSFGDVPVNTTDSVLIGIRTQGNVPLVINSVSTSTPFSPNFSGPVFLQPGPLLRIYPHVVPTVLGETRGWLIINHSAMSSPDSVELIVNGVVNLSSDDQSSLPTEFSLYQNYPNPFNPSTTITFDLPQAAPVNLKLYNLQGQLVRELIAEQSYSPGRHAIELDGTALGTGVYIYRLEAANFRADKKLLLLK